MTAAKLILASASPYRAEMLQRLGLAFAIEASHVDETPIAGEVPATLALRLAESKARAIAAQHPQAVVIGSDQVAELEGTTLGKPGDAATAVRQLTRASGRTVRFHTGLAVVQGAHEWRHVDLTTVQFRGLSDSEVHRYVAREKPFNCAGSFRCEGLGISLFEHIDSRDPTALVGLPLIALCQLLRQAGFEVP